MTYASMFSGVAGACQGFDLPHLWFCENNKNCQAVLRRHYPGVPIYDDVQTIPVDELEAPDVMWISPPCQDLSQAGKREGLAGKKSGLFYDAIDVIRRLRERTGKPELVFMEQVPGLLSSNGGNDIRIVLSAFLELRPFDVGWRTLDSRFWGVPQRRRRMFFVVDFAGQRADQILALQEGLHRRTPPRRQAGQVSASLLASGAGVSRPAGCASELDFLVPETYVPETVGALTAGAHPGGGNGQDAYTGHLIPVAFPQQANSDAIHAAGIDVSPTLQAINPMAVAHNWRVRRLTPVETERLQGWPDDWTAWGHDEKGQRVKISDAARYQMTGNGVTASVAKWLAGRLGA